MIPTGLKCKLMINTATQSTPTWAELNLVVDLTNNKQADKNEAACRRGGQFKQYGPGQMDFECSFNMLHDRSDAVWEKVQAAFWSQTPLHVRVMDGPFAPATADETHGFEMTWYVFGNNESQPLSGNVEDELTLAPSINGLTVTDLPIKPTRIAVEA